MFYSRNDRQSIEMKEIDFRSLYINDKKIIDTKDSLAFKLFILLGNRFYLIGGTIGFNSSIMAPGEKFYFDIEVAKGDSVDSEENKDFLELAYENFFLKCCRVELKDFLNERGIMDTLVHVVQSYMMEHVEKSQRLKEGYLLSKINSQHYIATKLSSCESLLEEAKIIAIGNTKRQLNINLFPGMNNEKTKQYKI